MVTYNQLGVEYNEGRYNAVTVSASASAVLGGVVAVADATPVPPAPAGGPVGGGRLPYAVSRAGRRRVRRDELVVVEPRRVNALCVPVTVGFAADVLASVTFSAEDDDLQVLLML
jgi:hypothetical protein